MKTLKELGARGYFLLLLHISFFFALEYGTFQLKVIAAVIYDFFDCLGKITIPPFCPAVNLHFWNKKFHFENLFPVCSTCMLQVHLSICPIFFLCVLQVPLTSKLPTYHFNYQGVNLLLQCGYF
jgi:hypothetical protein